MEHHNGYLCFSRSLFLLILIGTSENIEACPAPASKAECSPRGRSISTGDTGSDDAKDDSSADKSLNAACSENKGTLSIG